MRKLTFLEFIERANIKHNNFYNYDKVDYVNTSTKVTITCPIHGDFEQIPNKHMLGQGCPKCYRERQKFISLSNTLEFIEKSKVLHNNLYNYSKVKYINAKTPVTIICPTHGEFLLTPDSHLLGRGCPHCKSKHQSLVYLKLKQIFPKEEILYEVGNRVIKWLDGLRFDIYFPNLNIAVEYNGPLHYMPILRLGGEVSYLKTLLRDKEKRLKCKEHDCLLLELKYDYSEEDFNQLCLVIKDRTELIKTLKLGGTINGSVE